MMIDWYVIDIDWRDGKLLDKLRRAAWDQFPHRCMRCRSEVEVKVVLRKKNTPLIYCETCRTKRHEWIERMKAKGELISIEKAHG